MNKIFASLLLLSSASAFADTRLIDCRIVIGGENGKIAHRTVVSNDVLLDGDDSITIANNICLKTAGRAVAKEYGFAEASIESSAATILVSLDAQELQTLRTYLDTAAVNKSKVLLPREHGLVNN